jgi:hypothetical protein
LSFSTLRIFGSYGSTTQCDMKLTLAYVAETVRKDEGS